jgi:hypothetical protein
MFVVGPVARAWGEAEGPHVELCSVPNVSSLGRLPDIADIRRGPRRRWELTVRSYFCRDYSDDICRFDFIIASVHGQFRMEREAQTERLLRAVANPSSLSWPHDGAPASSPPWRRDRCRACPRHLRVARRREDEMRVSASAVPTTETSKAAQGEVEEEKMNERPRL